MNAVQGRLEQQVARSFDQLLTDPALNGVRYLPLTIPGDPNAQLAIQIRQIQNGDQDVLDLHVAACWMFRGRTMGEANGAMPCADSPADGNANWWINSPAMASTRVARRP